MWYLVRFFFYVQQTDALQKLVKCWFYEGEHYLQTLHAVPQTEHIRLVTALLLMKAGGSVFC